MSASTLRRDLTLDQSICPTCVKATAPSGPMRKLAGSTLTFHAVVAAESRSSNKGKRSPSESAVSRAVRALPPIWTARTTKGLPASAARSRSMVGNSTRQG